MALAKRMYPSPRNRASILWPLALSLFGFLVRERQNAGSVSGKEPRDVTSPQCGRLFVTDKVTKGRQPASSPGQKLCYPRVPCRFSRLSSVSFFWTSEALLWFGNEAPQQVVTNELGVSFCILCRPSTSQTRKQPTRTLAANNPNAIERMRTPIYVC